MTRSRMLRAAGLGGFLLAAAVSGSSSFAADADCKPLFDAMTQLFKTPSHQYIAQTDGSGKTAKSEIINSGSTLYVMSSGKWHKTPMTAAQLQQQEDENRRNAKVTSCHLLREESADGVKVRLFTVHTETETGTSDEQMWISKANGQLLREIIDMDMGTQGGKGHAEIHVSYAGVEAPADAQ